MDRQDGLFLPDPAGEAGEAPGVAEVLQVKEDDPGPLVLLPELEEVVGGDVRLGPKRDEARHAKPHLLGEGQHRPAQGAGLAGDGQDPLFGQGGEARRQAHPGVGVDEAQGARAQKAHPQPPRLVRQGLGLLRGEARGEDDGPPRSPAPRGLEGLRDPLLGHGHHHEVHGPGDALQAGVGEEGPHGPPSLPMASFTGKTGPWKRPKMRFSRTR